MGLKVRYRGNPSSVALLDSLLRDEGLQVDHRPIAERPSGQQDIVDVVFYVVDPDHDGSLGVAPQPLITTKIEGALARLRTSVPRAQAEIVATRESPAPAAPD